MSSLDANPCTLAYAKEQIDTGNSLQKPAFLKTKGDYRTA
jgi:hypothetical protein